MPDLLPYPTAAEHPGLPACSLIRPVSTKLSLKSSGDVGFEPSNLAEEN